MLIKNFSEYLISDNTPLIEAVKRLNDVLIKTLFIYNDENKLVAALSDGDIRRWIIKNGRLDSKVIEVAKRDPYTMTEQELSRGRQLLRKYDVGVLPVYGQDGIIGLFVDENIDDEKQLCADIPVVIMAGGKGTRLYPYTKILPKPLIPIGEKPIIERVIDSFFAQGVSRYYMILNYRSKMIRAYFGEIETPYSVEMIDEPVPLGTGGGLSLMKGTINETFIFTNCDTLIDEPLNEALVLHRKRQNAVTMICSMKNYTIPYGIIELDESGSIHSMREKPKMSFLTNTGTYIVEPEVLDIIPDNTEITFPEVIERCMNRGMNVSIYPISEDNWLDMGQFNELDKMKQRLKIED